MRVILNFGFDFLFYDRFFSYLSAQGGVLASGSVDGTMVLWDLSDGSKTNVLSQENGEAIRCCVFRYMKNASVVVFFSLFETKKTSKHNLFIPSQFD